MFRILVFISILAFTSCSTTKNINLEHIQDQKAKQVIEQAMAATGGLVNWEKKDRLKFRKWTRLYFEDGTIESDNTQTHVYMPEDILISWQDDDGKHVIKADNKDKNYEKYVNGVKIKPQSGTPLKNGLIAGAFVINIPFNLKDPGAQISYEGETTLRNGNRVHVVRAEYNGQQYKNHTTNDIWWHFFDVNSFISRGYKVKHLDHISLIENESYQTENGFTFAKQRKSYRVDDLGEVMYLRAEYLYDNFEVR